MDNFDEAVSGEVVTINGSNGLVEFKGSTILEAISSGGELEFLTAQLREKVETFEHDFSTLKGRKKSASFSNDISVAKASIGRLVEKLIAPDVEKVRFVRASFKSVAAEFDELRDTSKLPLKEWKAEDARLKAVEAARLEAEKLLEKFNNAHEMGLLLDDKYDRDIAEAMAAEYKAAKEEAERAKQEAKDLAAKQEAERIKRDARIAQEAADKAIADAKYKAELEAELVRVDKFNSDHEIALLTNNKLIADAEKIASDERANVQAEEAEKRRIEAVAKAKRDAKEAAEQARLNEIKRQEFQAKMLATEQAEREANKKNRLKKHKAAKKCFVEILGFSDKDATSAVQAIAKNLIDGVSIKY